MGKAGICLEQLIARGNKTIMALLLILLVQGPWEAMLVTAAGSEVHGAAVLLRQVTVSVLPISTEASGAANPAPSTSPYSFIALSTPFCPWPRTQLQILLSQPSLPKTAEKPWASAAFGHLVRNCLTDSNASKNLISKCKPIIQSK